MDQDKSSRWGKLSRGLTVSVALHALLLALILVGLPVSLPQPSAEETVAVELVPPPEEEALPEEEAVPEEPPPAPQEEPKVEEPPPPEEPEPEVEQPQAEAPPVAQEQAKAAQGMSLPVLRPVIQFAEKDAGPRETQDGNSGRQSGASEADQEMARPVPAVSSEKEPAPLPEADPAEARQEVLDKTALPGVNLLSTRASDLIESAEAVAEPAADPEETAETSAPAAKGEELPEVAELLSAGSTEDEMATTAMRDLPRGVRADQLCLTELREQLINAAPAYVPELLPSHRLGSGTKFEIRRTAFRAQGRWYDLSFRCEIDPDATRVVSFAFQVGDSIPKSEWSRRGFPEF